MLSVVMNRPVPIERIRVVDLLNGFASSVCWSSGYSAPPAVGATANVGVGNRQFQLVVDDFGLTPQGGWVRLVAPAARAAGFDAEVFSGEEGTSFQAVIESRTPLNGPPELSTKAPTIVADCSLADLLDDVCSRNPGWAWWTGPAGLEVGLPDPQPVDADGTVAAHTANGIEIRLAENPPRVGTTLRLPSGTVGTVLRTEVSWRAGTVPVFTATLGTVPARRRRPPCRSVRWPAKVVQLDPLRVELTDEEQPDRTFQAHARLMARTADARRFREDIPVQIGDVLEAIVPAGGVSALPVKVYVWAEALPSAAYRVRSCSVEFAVTEKFTATAGEIEETFTRRKSHVTERWDIHRD